MDLVHLRSEWASNVTRELLAGAVVALALIPEAIAFSIIAGVDPKVGLYASFCIAVVTAVAGGRPAMISAATGAMALLMVGLVKDHGVGYLFAATILTGLLQIAAGALRLGNLMRFVSRSVVTGFVNALAILIFLAQMPELIGQGTAVYLMTAVGLGIIYGLPYLTKAVPSPLVTIVLLTGVSMYLGFGIHKVGDMGALASELPWVALPQVPFTWETLRIILPVSLTLTMVGLLESLMTAAIVDEMTDTTSNKNRECAGQGVANIASGFLGGMAGCAMIGQSVINVSSGGRGRLSTLFSGVFLLFLIVVLGPYVAQIPMAALVAVMIMVSINTFQWKSFRTLVTHPKSSSFVMLGTVAVVVATHDLAKGVLFGVILSGLFFAHKVTKFFGVASSRDEARAVRTYKVTGQIFFATAEAFHSAFDFREEDLRGVVLDLTAAHFWDITSVNALDRVVLKFRHHGIPVDVIGMNEATATMVERLGTHDKPGAALAAPGH
ncbi:MULTISPECIES: SulP family inorganic anion transporter [Methylobacterium]|jgi:SulP family sulfate permease|uniref:SulP family inorganic anion transporter n=1 Tax=Methylobacterium TaxID=407 RepID=UPI0008EAD229|nr:MULTISPECIES: SulP family inorganic anion transporter [Methylobacterium]MBZ6414763.1 SulP family inorganic anion transporter [Methylobacterium sp.]MBK3397729.1 SulP family inorganic anion transporter [Methylobacterium ajmalii]MBK3411665.1 SulP family inorganic anion transporter [Methylobacterium ajmalii]MBK3425476.1 SulP family inorganic anion transporter [Methylobacterium ajmalii]SFF75664.1 sulfate permease, SulP family [Methylobacterium sp. yr596]